MSDQTTEAETRLLAYLANDPSSGPWPLDADIHALIAEVRKLREYKARALNAVRSLEIPGPFSGREPAWYNKALDDVLRIFT